MKKNNKKTFKMVSLSLLMLLIPAMVVIAITVINPGTTTNFAILAGSTITNTGSTVISGNGADIGLYPGTSFVNQEGVTTSGTIHLTDGVASTAKEDLVTVYNQVSGMTPVTTIASELGGQTLKAGVYNSADGTFEITGTLTLDAEGDSDAIFIFQTESSLITASDSNVNLINAADYCQVFWQVGSSATLGTNSNFAGRIYAMTSITATTGAEIEGQLLAREGSVTLDTNKITNTNCAVTTTIDGGQLPESATNLYQLLAMGILLAGLGITIIVIGVKNEKVKITDK